MRVLRPLALPAASLLVSSNGTVTRTLGACAPAVPVASELIARAHLPTATALWLCGHLGEYRNALVLTFDRVLPDGPNQGDDTRGALVIEHLDNLYSSIARWMEANEPYIDHISPIESALTDADPPIQAMLCGTIERMRAAEARLLQHPGIITVGHTPDTRRRRTTKSPSTAPNTPPATSRFSISSPPAAAKARRCSPSLPRAASMPARSSPSAATTGTTSPCSTSPAPPS